jgi:hypothetical protein
MLRLCLGLVGGILLTQTLPAGQPGYSAELIGGTLPGIAAKSSTKVDLRSIDALQLHSGHTDVLIPYSKVNSLEYGQNVSRRYVEAVLVSPIFLLAKSKKHFVTVGYQDSEGRQQALVFRVSKGDIRAVLAGLEARTGRRVEYQDDNARKNGQ